jgi:hypothetical protein
MAVTRFESVVSAQSVGAQDVENLAASFEKLSGSIDNAAAKSKKAASAPVDFDWSAKLKAGIQDPLGAVGDAFESVTKAAGPMGVAVGAGVGIFTAVGVAGFEAAKALGEYGVQIRDVQLRTGLAAKEVGQYSFAAKAVGQDVSIVDRLMRGLTMAVEDQTSKGEKARVWLRQWGVDTAGLKDGTASTSEALTKIGAGFETLPAGVARTAAALDIFKRVGIEAIPFLTELSKNLDVKVPVPNEESIARWVQYEREIAAVEMKWAALKRSAMEPLALTVLLTIKKASEAIDLFEAPSLFIGNLLLGGKATATDKEMIDTKGAGYGDSMSRSAHEAEQRALAYNNSLVEAAQSQTGATDAEKLTKAKAKLDELLGSLKTNVLSSQNDAAFGKIKDQRDAVAVIEARIKATKDLTEAEKALAALRKQSDEALIKAALGEPGNPLAKYNAALGKIQLDQAASLASKNPQTAAGADAAFNEQRNALWFTLQTDTAKLFAEFDKKGEELGRTYLESIDKKARETVKVGEDYFREHPEIFGTNNKPPLLTGMASPEQALRDSRDAERRGVSLYGVQAALAGTPEVDQAYALEALRKKFADDQYTDMSRMAALKHTEVERDLAEEAAIDDRHQKRFDAELERQQALLQLALKQKQEFQTLMVGLVDSVLHGGTSAFLKQQAEHLLDQIIGNAAGMAWKSVSKIIPHSDSKLLAGTMFGQDPLKGATDLNTGATIDNTAAMATFTARMEALSASSGGGGLVRGGVGIFTGAGGVDFPAQDPNAWMRGDLTGIEAQTKAVQDLEAAQKAVAALTFPAPKGDLADIGAQVQGMKDLEAAQKAIAGLTFPAPKGDLADIGAQVQGMKDLEAAQKAIAGLTFPAPKGDLADIGAQVDPLKGATAENTLATIANTEALLKMALSPSGGGGGLVRGGVGIFTGTGGVDFPAQDPNAWMRGGGEAIGSGDPTIGLTQLPSGLWQRGPVGSGAESGAGVPEPTYMPADLISGGVGFPKNDPNAWMRGGMSSLGRGIGIGGAALAAGYGAYRGFSQGGAQGDLAGASAILGAASLIPGPQQPFIMAAAMVTALLPSLLPDPKAQRDKEESSRLDAARYTAPTVTAYTRDRYGRDYDTDVSGNLRPIVHVNVSTMDAKSFLDNSAKILEAVTVGLEAKNSPRASMALRNTVRG